MTKTQKTITLDEEVCKVVEREAEQTHIDFSTRLNQILHDYIKEVKRK